jgi:cytidine deaminase
LKKKKTDHQIRKQEFEELRKVIELDFIKRLVAQHPKPQLRDAERLILEAPIQEAAVYAAVELWKLAKHFQENGHRFSYRNFLVIAAAIGIICRGNKCKWTVRTATNTKWIKGRYPKHCAEMRVMKAMHQRGATIVGMVVMGIPQPEDGTPTLHPCDLCRLLMRGKYRTLFQPFTRFILVHPDDPRREGYTIGDLMARHLEHI